MPPGFKDHFSDASDNYASYRPDYPPALFQWLSEQSPRRECVWDCATGSGQAAVALARYFQRVVATDASHAQIQAAHAHPVVRYSVAAAEHSGLADGACDLVTVAQAFHWFEADAFTREAARVLRADGLLAVWCYETCSVTRATDAVVLRLYDDIVGPFWPPERALIESGYRDIDLPGKALAVPAFDMAVEWGVDEMLGYLRTWSACRRFLQQHGEDPVALIESKLRAAWGTRRRLVRWPLSIRVCRPNTLD